MKVAVMLLVLIAYGDSPDYIPASSPSQTANVNDRGSSFGRTTDRDARHFGERTAGPSSRSAADFVTDASPQPLNRSWNFPKTISDSPNAAGAVQAARFAMDDEWPNGPMDEPDVRQHSSDPTKANGHPPFPLSSPNQSQVTRPADEPSPAGSSATGRRDRYIPANLPARDSFQASGSSQPFTTNANGNRSNAGQPRFGQDQESALAPAPTFRTGGAGQPTSTQPEPTGRLWPANTNHQGSADPFHSNSAPSGMDVTPRVAQNLPVQQTVQRQPTATDALNGLPPVKAGATPQTTNPPTSVGGQYLPPGPSTAQGGLVSQTPDNGTSPVSSATREAEWERLAQQARDERRRTAAAVVHPPNSGLSATSPGQSAANPTDTQRFPAADTNLPSLHGQSTTPGGSVMTTMLALFGSIGLNLYLGWVAWDTYNRYQDLVHDVRYTGSRREPIRDEFGERVGESAY